MTKFAIGLGILFIVVETTFMILEGGAPFWPMWAKNYLVGALLIISGVKAFRAITLRNWTYLISAWGFAVGVFLISALAILQVDRPVEIAFALGVYTCLCLTGLIGTLRNTPDR
jgi:hypothetical protein